MHDASDITIIGGGPTGLFAAFYAGLRGVSCRIIDALPQLGGQLAALYPEKYVYDVGGLPRILAKDLAQNMIAQGTQFAPDIVLGTEVTQLVHDDDGIIRLVTARGDFPTRAVVITAGKGALSPRTLDCPGWQEHYHDHGGIHTHVARLDDFRGRRVLIIGGGDSAVDWALALQGVASELTLIHRRNEFRAHGASIAQMRAAAADGVLRILTPCEVSAIHGNGCVHGATILDADSGAQTRLDIDAVIALLGFKPDLGPIASWGLELERNSIRVSPHMETNLTGVWAAGDVTHHAAKLELIATGYAEAAIAVNNAVHYLDPKARVNPGHSTNLKRFAQDVGA